MPQSLNVLIVLFGRRPTSTMSTVKLCGITTWCHLFWETNKHQNLMRPRHPIVRPSTCSTIPPLMLPRRPFDVVGNGQGASDDAVEDADDVHTAVILWREKVLQSME